MKTVDIITASKKVGGSFRLTALLQRRVTELMHGAPPLVYAENPRDFIEIALNEVLNDKINLVFDPEEREEIIPTQNIDEISDT